VDAVIVLPRLHANDGAGEVGEVVHGASHRTEDAGHSFLTRHTGVDTSLGPAPSTAAERVDATPRSWNADRAGNIRANANAASHSQERALTTGRATGRVGRNMRVETVAPEGIGRLE
jgi:hypothetical protein